MNRYKCGGHFHSWWMQVVSGGWRWQSVCSSPAAHPVLSVHLHGDGTIIQLMTGFWKKAVDKKYSRHQTIGLEIQWSFLLIIKIWWCPVVFIFTGAEMKRWIKGKDSGIYNWLLLSVTTRPKTEGYQPGTVRKEQWITKVQTKTIA